jgi:hypothetical protein
MHILILLKEICLLLLLFTLCLGRCRKEKTKRQSGAFGRKRKNDRDTEREKLRGSMLKYLKMDENEPAISTTKVSSQFSTNSKNEFETETSNESHQPEDRLDEQMYEEIVPCASDTESNGDEENMVNNCLEITTGFDIEKPYFWPTVVNNRTTGIIIQSVPVMVQNIKCPAKDSGRSFSVSQYMRVYQTVKKIQRIWLVYSKKSNSVFCF